MQKIVNILIEFLYIQFFISKFFLLYLLKKIVHLCVGQGREISHAFTLRGELVDITIR